MKLYTTPTSPYGRLALIAMHEKDVAARVAVIWTRTRNPDDPLLAVNPSGRIPFLLTDDGIGYEDTDIIVDYLDSLAGPRRFAPPGGESDWPFRRHRAMARSMLDGLAVWAREVIRPAGEHSPGIVDHECRRAQRLADAFEAAVTAPPFTGPLNMPQLLLFCALDVECRLPAFDWRTGRPALVAWHARLSTLPSVQASLPPAAG